MLILSTQFNINTLVIYLLVKFSSVAEPTSHLRYLKNFSKINKTRFFISDNDNHYTPLPKVTKNLKFQARHQAQHEVKKFKIFIYNKSDEIIFISS